MVAARAVIEGDHVPLASRRPDLDDALVRAVERAMDRDPQARFPSAAAMGAALAPPAVPTIVPEPGDATVVGPGVDGTQVLDLSDLAAATAAPAALEPTAPTSTPSTASTMPAPTTTSATASPAPPAGPPAVAAGIGAPPVVDPEEPDVAPAPLAGRRRPSLRLRVGLAALAAVALVFLLVQVFDGESADDLVAGVAQTAATTPTTAAPTTTLASPGAALAAEMRAAAGGLGGDDGAAAADLAGRLRTIADHVERGEVSTGAIATGLLVDVARWYQSGQLTGGAAVTAVQLLQKVPGVAVAGSAPAAASPPPAANASPEVFVPTNDAVKDKPDKGKDDKDD